MPSTTRTPFLQHSDGALLKFLVDSHFCFGSIFFVDASHSNAGTSSGKGQSPDAPFSTLDAAIGACTADKGDLILVGPAHTETITAAAGIALDVAGVKILGVGEGRRRPRITFGTAVGASFDISAARCVVDNLVLINAIDAQTAMVNVTAADCVIRGCEFQLGDGTTEAVLGILTTDAADRLTIEGNHFWSLAAAGNTAAIRIVGTDNTKVLDNIITGLYATTGAIEQVTTAGNDHIYARNRVLNRTADGNNKALVLKADTTALLYDNILAVIDSTSPAPWTAAAGYFGHNYWVGAVDTAGTLR